MPLFDHWTQLASFAIAAIAFTCSVASYRVSRRALKLSEEKDRRLAPNLKIVVENSLSIERDREAFYILYLSILNQSDASNSIASCELRLNYHREDGTTGNFYLGHNPSLSTEIENLKARPLTIPFRLSAHEIHTGIAIFKFDREPFEHLRIDSHEVVVLDTSGIEKIRPTNLLGALPNG